MVKKKRICNMLWLFLLLIVFVSFAGYNMICNVKRNKSELVLANVEALAGGGTSSFDYPSYGNGFLSCSWFPIYENIGSNNIYSY